MSSKIPSLDDPEFDLSDIADVIPNGHLILTRLERNLQNHIIDLWRFYSKTEPDQEKNGVPYQYLSKHQEEWANAVMPISRQLSAVDPLIMEKYMKLYSMEIAKSTVGNQQQPPMNDSDLASTIVNVMSPETPQKPKGEGIMAKLGLGRKSDKGSGVTPFSLSVNDVMKKKNTMQKFYDYLEFHNFGLDWSESMSISEPNDFKWMDYTGIMNYLSIEKTEFKIRINEVVTLISEGYESVRATEKEYAVKVLTGAVQLGERHRPKF